jgi:hypothetical protein
LGGLKEGFIKVVYQEERASNVLRLPKNPIIRHAPTAMSIFGQSKRMIILNFVFALDMNLLSEDLPSHPYKHGLFV